MRVTPAVVVAVSVKLSGFSVMESSTTGVRTSTLVVPGVKVTDAAVAHVVPPLVETSSPEP